MFENLLQGIKNKLNPVQQNVNTGVSSAISSAAKVFPTVSNFVQKQAQQWQQKEANQLATKIATQAGNAFNNLGNSYFDVAENPQNKLSQAFNKVNLPVSTPLIPNKQLNIPVGNVVKDLVFKTREQAQQNDLSSLFNKPIQTMTPQEKDYAINEASKRALNLSMMMGLNAPNAVKTVNPSLLTENVTPKVEQNFMKLKGANQPDFVAGESGISKVKEIGKKKLSELFPVKTEQVGVGQPQLQLPSGEVPKPNLALPEGFNPVKTFKESLSTDVSPKTTAQAIQETHRVFENILPPRAYQAVKPTLNKMYELRGQAADFIDATRKAIVDLGIAPGSEESIMARQLRKGETTYEQLVKKVGQESADKIKNAVDYADNFYRVSREMANAQRSAVGLPEIPFRENYARDIKKSSGNLDRLFSGDVNTSRTSSSIEKQKMGEGETDLISGLIDYAEKVSRSAFTDTVVPELRNFEKLSTTEAQRTAFKHVADQIEGVGSFNLADKVNSALSPVRAAKVIGNLSSAVVQTANVPLAASKSGWDNYVRGFFSKDAESAIKNSAVIKDRALKMPSELVQGGYNKFKNSLGGVLQDADLQATKTMWKGFYEQAKKNGIADAYRYAEDMTLKHAGDRGLGGLSQFQKSGIGKLIAPYTIEAQNSYNQLIETIGKKDVKTILGYIASAYAFNTVAENTVGYRPLQGDLIQSAMDSYKNYKGTDKISPSKIKAIGRLVSEFLPPRGTSSPCYCLRYCTTKS